MPTVVPAGFWNVRYWPVGIWTESNLQPKVSSRNFLVSLRFVLASSVNAIAPGVLDLFESFPPFIGRDMSKKVGEQGINLFSVSYLWANMAANGLASKKTCIDLTLPFSAWIHSAQGTVPAGVLVARSYTKQTSLPSTNAFLLCTPVPTCARRLT